MKTDRRPAEVSTRRPQHTPKPVNTSEKQLAIPTHFFKIILSPHASNLRVPDEFIRKYGSDLQDVVSLEVPSGAKWRVQLQNTKTGTWLKKGWNQFKEYYSLGSGYFVLFQYNGDSHFSVSIFDLSASEVEYPSGPNENARPEKTTTTHNAYDEKRVKIEVPDEEDDLYFAAQQEKRKEVTKYKHEKRNMDMNFGRAAADKGKEYCNGAHPPDTKITKMTKRKYSNEESKGTARCVKPNNTIVADSSHSGAQKVAVPLSSHRVLPERKELSRAKLDKTNSAEQDFNYAAQKAKRVETNTSVLPQGKEPTRVKLEKMSSGEQDFGHATQKVAVPLSTPSVLPKRKKRSRVMPDKTNSAERAKRVETNMGVLPEGKEPNRVKLEKVSSGEQDFGCAAQKVAVPLSSSSVLPERKEPSTVNLEKTNSAIQDFHCAAENTNRVETNMGFIPEEKEPSRVKLDKMNPGEQDFSCAAQKAKAVDTNVEKLEKQDVKQNWYNEAYKLKAHSNEVVELDPPASDITASDQHNVKKNTTSLDVSRSRYPLRSKTLKDVKLEECKVRGDMDDLKLKNQVVANASRSRYPLRSKTLEEVKLEVGIDTDNLNSKNRVVADTPCSRYPLRSTTLKDVKLEESKVGKDTDNLKSMNRVVADASCSRYPLRSKQLEEVRLEQSEAGTSPRYPLRSKQQEEFREIGQNSDKVIKSKNKAVADSPYRKRVKLDKADSVEDLSCAEKRKVTSNVKLEKRISFAAIYKGKEGYGSEAGIPPQFIVSMKPAYVSKSPKLNIPLDFYQSYFEKGVTIVTLRVSDGRTWPAKCSCDSHSARIESPGWKDFVLANGLKVYDTCVVELMEKGIEPVLDVTIFRA